MSNRVLGFLVILIFILVGIAFFMYAFLYNNSKFIVNSNIENYSIELYHKNTLKKYNFSCSKKECELNDIPPFEYKLTLTKTGYIQKVLEKELPRNETIKIQVNFKKKIELTEVIENKKNNSISTESSLNKINNKIEKENIRKKLEYSFLDKIELLKKSNKEKIKVIDVIGDKNIFLIIDQENKYFYNTNTANLEKINLNINIEYIKKNSNFKADLVTEKGIFTYSFINKKVKYFTLFKDYINYKGNYIGVIETKDKTRKTNFGFENDDQNLIILYNNKNLSKKIIFKTGIKIKKILLSNNEVIIINSENKKFKLENFE